MCVSPSRPKGDGYTCAWAKLLRHIFGYTNIPGTKYVHSLSRHAVRVCHMKRNPKGNRKGSTILETRTVIATHKPA